MARYPWPAILATLAVATALYVLGLAYVSGRLADVRRQELALQQARLNEMALRLEDYVGVPGQLAHILASASGREQERFPGTTMSVNVSATRVIGVDLVAKVRAVLDATHLDPTLLKLELTETAIMESQDDGLAVLSRLRDLGMQIVIDDFGTGRSSLSYVQRLPVAGLKIDRSFVAPMLSSAQALEIVRVIVGLAKSFALHVTAEGVEEAGQAEQLSGLGVDYCQGFYYSPAIDVPDLERFMAARLPEEAVS